MIGIRGATTLTCDCESQIRESVFELLKEIISNNDIKTDEIVSVIFSTTKDITAYYPAKVAREFGLTDTPLFSAMEPDIKGSLKLCVRVLMFVDKKIKAKHVYLRGAKSLRKDITKINIALDGPAGSGKSTVAKILAKDMNILYLDTGAMYRACALKALKCGIDSKDEKGVKTFIDDINLKIEYKNGAQITILDDIDVSTEIRKNEVSMLASNISALKCVRLKMVDMQRKIASQMSCVLDGRDIGSFVLPDADVKFYITASSEVRAQRRFKELKEKGQKVDFNALHEEIKARDKQDMSRDFAPLKQADDAFVVDTSNMSIEQVVDFIKNKIQEKI